MAKLRTTLAGPSPQPPAYTLSPQQSAIIEFVRRSNGNAIIEARAGTGKTTTLVEVCKHLTGSVAFVAFNKAIATEIERKLSAAGVDTKRVRAGTFHSAGYGAWKRVAPNFKLDDEKVEKIMSTLAVHKNLRPFVGKLVGLAKQHLIGVLFPMNDDEEWMRIVEHFDLEDLISTRDDDIEDGVELVELGVSWALRVLQESNERGRDTIDFSDMVYLPLLYNAPFWQNDWVLIDEAQDTNGARRELAKRMLRPGGRLIAVGDPYQAIYGFTGADNDALEILEREFECSRLPLTVTYRCPQQVVAFANEYVTDIEAAPTAPFGLVASIDYGTFLRVIPEPTDSILCRNMKPLAKLAFGYLRRQIPCHIEGRDLGSGLITLARKWKTPRNVEELSDKLTEYLDEQRAKLKAAKKLQKLAAIEDKVETLQVLLEGMDGDDPIQAVIDLINRMFKDSDGLPKPTITLCTVHRSKGREWPRVYLYGREELMPSPYAKQEWQLDQERNLIYVAITRAQEELIEVVLPGSSDAVTLNLTELQTARDLNAVLSTERRLSAGNNTESVARLVSGGLTLPPE